MSSSDQLSPHLENLDRPWLYTVCLSSRDFDRSGSLNCESELLFPPLQGSPLVDYPNMDSRPREPLRAHEARGACADDEDINLAFLGGHSSDR